MDKETKQTTSFSSPLTKQLQEIEECKERRRKRRDSILFVLFLILGIPLLGVKGCWSAFTDRYSNQATQDAVDKTPKDENGAPIYWEDMYTRPGSTVTLEDLSSDNTQGNENAEETFRLLETDSD